MFFRVLLAILILPGTALVLVPAAIIVLAGKWGYYFQVAAPGTLAFWAAFIFGISGFILSLWSMSLFLRFGKGTPAPWDPPRRFVIRGPYRHVRNPMISGVVLMLLAEALFFQSWQLAVWTVVFFLGNALYFRLVEEPELKARFGNDYLNYCQHVGRWIPRITSWHPLE